MNIGQQGDTRKFRKLKSTDWYDSKPAFEAEKRQPKNYPKCKTCGQYITVNRNFNGYCLRCDNE